MDMENTTQTPTKAQITAAFAMTVAVSETIRELGEVPEGTLYAMLMDKIDLRGFQSMVATLVSAGLVSNSSHLLRWTGPSFK